MQTHVLVLEKHALTEEVKGPSENSQTKMKTATQGPLSYFPGAILYILSHQQILVFPTGKAAWFYMEEVI